MGMFTFATAVRVYAAPLYGLRVCRMVTDAVTLWSVVDEVIA
jgi:hypothetical protein